MKNKLTTFYIVRHGETDWNAKRIIQGLADIPLNETGEQQARDLAEEFKNIHFDLVFSSDLLRAKRTVEIIALERKLTVQTTEALRERIFGEFEGKASEEMSRTLSDLVKKLSRKERLRFRLSGNAESDEELISRIFTFLRETAIANSGKTVLIGTHGGVIRALLLHLEFMSYEKLSNKRILNCASVVLMSDGTEFFIREVKGLEDV